MKSKKKQFTLFKVSYKYDEKKVNDHCNEDTALDIVISTNPFPNVNLPAHVLMSIAKFEKAVLDYIDKLVLSSQPEGGEE